ncbi:hypothetical protein [Saccharothrix sp. HUAS TT1]|uniref:hypothetical protein n=1 Tax=unclassified Saccharothrix TaxID=2593673 RepID=UPI00345BD9CB
MTGRWRAVLATAAVVGLALIGVPPSAQAADCAGVTVVVDFGPLGGGVRTGCAPGDPASGTAALTAAGFGYTFAARQPGFVCRINGLPGSDPCVTTSPPTAYWGYWHARPGGSWVYSDTSAAAHDPAPGTVDGWAFGGGGQPGIAPPAPQPTRPAPQPPAPDPGRPAQPVQPGQPGQPGQPAPPAPQPGQPTRPAQPTESTTQSEPVPTTTTETTTPPPSTSSAATTSGSPAPTSATSVAVQPTAGTSSGGAVGLVVGVVVIAALAGLGVWTARRRAKAAG